MKKGYMIQFNSNLTEDSWRLKKIGNYKDGTFKNTIKTPKLKLTGIIC